jgi:hypothetical protein
MASKDAKEEVGLDRLVLVARQVGRYLLVRSEFWVANCYERRGIRM